MEGRLEFEKGRLAAVEKRCAGMDNPSSLMVYSVLGSDEQEYARALKADVVNARPDLAAVLPEWNDERTKVREAIGMLTVRIFGQFSFHFPIQFLIENELKNESKIGLFMKMGPYGPFS